MDYYKDGFRNGRLDAMLGLRLITALTSRLPGYAQGYYDGQMAREEEVWARSH